MEKAQAVGIDITDRRLCGHEKLPDAIDIPILRVDEDRRAVRNGATRLDADVQGYIPPA